MEKRFLGIILSVLGVAGLIFAAANFINGGSGAHHVRQIVAYGVLGVISFAAGVSLVRTTRTGLLSCWFLVAIYRPFPQYSA